MAAGNTKAKILFITGSLRQRDHELKARGVVTLSTSNQTQQSEYLLINICVTKAFVCARQTFYLRVTLLKSLNYVYLFLCIQVLT